VKNDSTPAEKANLRIAGDNLGLGFRPMISVVLENGKSATWELWQVLDHLQRFCASAQKYVRGVLPFSLQYDALSDLDRNAILNTLHVGAA